MKRREFIALVGGSALALPLAARAQQPGKLPTIGCLGSDAETWRPWSPAFVQRLRELGWIDGRTVAIEYRWSEGHPERAAEIAAEFVRLKVDIILTVGPAVAALKQATSVIPIVFAVASDPVGGGLVASLARPGATSPDCRFSRPILPVSGSNSCGKSSPGYTGWLSWWTLAIPQPYWRWVRSKP